MKPHVTCLKMSYDLYDFITTCIFTCPCPWYLSAGLNRKVVTRNSCMANIGSHAQPVTENHIEQTLIESQSVNTVALEVGSLVEVVSNSGITVYGVLRWLGVPGGKTAEWAGIELVSDYKFVQFFQHALVIPHIHIVCHCSRTTRWRAALMGRTVVRGISHVERAELCLFPSQNAAPIAGFWVPHQERRPSKPLTRLQVRQLTLQSYTRNKNFILQTFDIIGISFLHFYAKCFCSFYISFCMFSL